MNLELGFSPCPNDTFIFDPLVRGGVSDPGIRVTPVIEDVETLNQLVRSGRLPVSKVSFHLLGHVRDRYLLLRSGAALGRGCGPLLVARTPLDSSRLRGKRIAIPGVYTTAALLLRLYDPTLSDLVPIPFDQIMPAIRRGDVDAGVIIHESRFTYRSEGLVSIRDLGEWWEEYSGFPIPLGGIVCRRDLPEGIPSRLERVIRESILYSRRHPEEAEPFIRRHAQEMDPEVCASHISLYVTDFSVDLGEEGVGAIGRLFREAEEKGVIPRYEGDIYIP
ncbi:MAG: 1,4-dihydroxy-6-naphthoate synthase [Desulfuromonadia bacterium]